MQFQVVCLLHNVFRGMHFFVSIALLEQQKPRVHCYAHQLIHSLSKMVPIVQAGYRNNFPDPSAFKRMALVQQLEHF